VRRYFPVQKSPFSHNSEDLHPLASAHAVEAVLERLRSSLPELIPRFHKNLFSLLNSVCGLYMRQPTET